MPLFCVVGSAESFHVLFERNERVVYLLKFGKGKFVWPMVAKEVVSVGLTQVLNDSAEVRRISTETLLFCFVECPKKIMANFVPQMFIFGGSSVGNISSLKQQFKAQSGKMIY